MEKAKLSPRALGLSFGIVGALSMLIVGLWPMLGGGGQETITLISERYKGFESTPTGIILGVVYGFIDGLIGGLLIAWLYNLCLRK